MRRAYTALAVIGAAIGLFLVVCLHVLLAQGQAQLDDLDKRAEKEQVQNGRLRVAVAELESPSRIATAARERLGMVAPRSVTFLKAADPSLPPTTPATRPTTARTTPTTAPRQTTPTTAASSGMRAGGAEGARG